MYAVGVGGNFSEITLCSFGLAKPAHVLPAVMSPSYACPTTPVYYYYWLLFVSLSISLLQELVAPWVTYAQESTWKLTKQHRLTDQIRKLKSDVCSISSASIYLLQYIQTRTLSFALDSVFYFLIIFAWYLGWPVLVTVAQYTSKTEKQSVNPD